MGFQPSRLMELVLVVALGLVVIVVIVAMQGPPGDRTRFTVQPSDTSSAIGERREPLHAEETAPGR